MANTKITTNVIADDAVTSDKLGGDLTMPGHVSLADNKELRIGTGNDLVIKHDGSHTTLTNTTGNFTFIGDQIYFANAANNEYLAQFIADGACSLRFNNTEELATVSGGVYIPNELGIGTNSPGTLLHLYNSSNAQMTFQNSTTGTTVGSDGYDITLQGSDIYHILRDSGSQLFYTAGAKRVDIDSAGTLKVGAVVPTPGSGWDANLDAIQVGEASAFRSGDTDYSAATVVSTNIYQTGGGDKLLNGTDFGTAYTQQGGNHYFYGYNNGSADATPAVDANDNANPLIIYKGGGISLSGGGVSNTNNGKAGIFWHGNPANGADYCIRRTNDAWSGSNYAQLLIDWDTGVKIDVGNGAYGKSYLEVNGNVKFTAAGQGIDFSANSGHSGSESEVLDWYEKGTFTPNLSHSYTVQTAVGRYVRVGDLVHFVIQIGNQVSNITSSNQFTVEGLPFPVFEAHAAGSCFARYIDEPDNVIVYVTTQEALHLYSSGSGSWGSLYYSNLNSASAYFYITGTYRAV